MIEDVSTAPDVTDLADVLSADDPHNAQWVASALAVLGIKVMPVQGGRKFAIPGTKGLEGATSDPGAVAELWAEGEKSSMTPGVAVEPASAGLAVVTCGNQYAIEAWKMLTGADLMNEAALISKTPGGGRHFWFKMKSGDVPVSTHMPDLGLKTSGGYIIVNGGDARRIQRRQYRHELTVGVDGWTELVLPRRLFIPQGFGTGECSDDHVNERIDDMGRMVDASEDMARYATDVIEEALRYTSRSSDGFSAECASAFSVIEALANRSLDGKIHLGDALLKAESAWGETCDDAYGSPQAVDLVWRYIRNVVISGDDFAPATASTISLPSGHVSDLDWREPFGSNGEVKKIPLNVIADDEISIATALSNIWEVEAQAVVAAIERARAAQKDEPTGGIITQDEVFENVFGGPNWWMMARRHVNVTAIKARLDQRSKFRVGPDGDLWRFNFSGVDNGLWTSDGEDFLVRMLIRMLGSYFTLTARNTIQTMVLSHADGLQLPNDESTWQNDGIIYCANGVVDWRSAAQPRPARPSDNLTVRHSWEWDPDATCPEFDSFVGTTFPEDAIDTVFEIAGACLYPKAPWKKAIIVYGPKNSGKSTFLKVLTSLVGSQHVSSMSLQQIGENDFMTGELFGKRVNICGDISSDEMPDPAKFKVLVGGDEPIQADRKHKKPFSFPNRAKLIFSANELPRTRDKSSAYFERWIPLRCERIVSESDVDLELPDRLTTASELAGIGRKAVLGLARIMEKNRFTIPQSSQDALDEYRLQEDFVRAWFYERVEFTGNVEHIVHKDDIRADHMAWCDSNGIRRPATNNMLAKTAATFTRDNPGFVWSEKRSFGRDGAEARVAIGMRLKPAPAKVDTSWAE